MHRRILLFVMLKYWFFHIAIYFIAKIGIDGERSNLWEGRVQQTIVFYLIRKNRSYQN